jgi:hypothetical protein
MRRNCMKAYYQGDQYTIMNLSSLVNQQESSFFCRRLPTLCYVHGVGGLFFNWNSLHLNLVTCIGGGGLVVGGAADTS